MGSGAQVNFGPISYSALQVCAIAGCFAVAVYWIQYIPEEEEVAEGFAWSMVMMGWIAYCFLTWLLSGLAQRYLGRLGLLCLLVAPAIALALSLYANGNSFGDFAAGFIVLAVVLSLPIVGGIFQSLRKKTSISSRPVPLPLEGRG